MKPLGKKMQRSEWSETAEGRERCRVLDDLGRIFDIEVWGGDFYNIYIRCVMGADWSSYGYPSAHSAKQSALRVVKVL